MRCFLNEWIKAWFQVMNLFLRKLGVPGVWGVQDVGGLEPDLLAMLPTPVLGIMLLFPVNDHYHNAAQVHSHIIYLLQDMCEMGQIWDV